MDAVTEAVDRGEPVDVVFLDFAKAFDQVPKKRLTEKLKAHGIGGNILRWISNWLDNRHQRVVINGRSSSWKEVLSGVPQGSVLGPLLFLIFINDLDESAATAKIQSAEGKDDLQTALDSLYTWSEKWGMIFNVSKCKVGNAHWPQQ